MTAANTTMQAKKELLARKLEQMTDPGRDYVLEVLRMNLDSNLSIREIFVNLAPKYGIDPSIFDNQGGEV